MHHAQNGRRILKKMNAQAARKINYASAEWSSMSPDQQLETIAAEFAQGTRVAVKSAYAGEQFLLTFEYPEDARFLRTSEILGKTDLAKIRALAEDKNCVYAQTAHAILQYL